LLLTLNLLLLTLNLLLLTLNLLLLALIVVLELVAHDSQLLDLLDGAWVSSVGGSE